MTSIKLDNVSIKFPTSNVPLKRAILDKFSSGAPSALVENHVALQSISLSLQNGDRLAIMGNNGAGKTTLLRVLAGVYEPYSGSIETKGKVTSLISVTAGMELHLSGRENIFVKGAYLGLTKAQIEKIEHDVIEFADLGGFIDMPVKKYSSGMLVRLAFAISTSIPVDILLLDEWLSAGDKNFVEKSDIRMKSLVGRSSLLVFASHSIEYLKTWCNKAIILDKGVMSPVYSNVEEAATVYLSS